MITIMARKYEKNKTWSPVFTSSPIELKEDSQTVNTKSVLDIYFETAPTTTSRRLCSFRSVQSYALFLLLHHSLALTSMFKLAFATALGVLATTAHALTYMGQSYVVTIYEPGPDSPCE
jgi:hypothetical protein